MVYMNSKIPINSMTKNSENSEKWTTISIKQKTRDEIASYGTKDTSFEDILQNLLESWRKNN